MVAEPSHNMPSDEKEKYRQLVKMVVRQDGVGGLANLLMAAMPPMMMSVLSGKEWENVKQQLLQYFTGPTVLPALYGASKCLVRYIESEAPDKEALDIMERCYSGMAEVVEKLKAEVGVPPKDDENHYKKVTGLTLLIGAIVSGLVGEMFWAVAQIGRKGA